MKKSPLIFSIFILFTLLLCATDSNGTAYKNNFYKAVNKQWLQTHMIPEDKSSISTFMDIDDKFIKNSQRLMEKLIKKEKCSADEQKLVDYYLSYTDMKSRNAKGITVLQPILKKIDTVKGYGELAVLMIDLKKEGLTVPYDIGVTPDSDDATKYILGAAQSGLFLQKKYYEDNSSAAQKKRDNYKAYIHECLSLAKFNNVDKMLLNDMKVETTLAKYSYSLVDLYDVKVTHNPVDFHTLEKMLSHFNMPLLFKTMEYPENIKINVNTPKYFKALNELFKEIPVEVWKDYLKTQVVLSYSVALGEDFVEALHHYSAEEGLASKLEPLDVRAIRDMSGTLDYLFGKVYVETYFSDTVKSKVESILQSILSEYKTAIENTTRFSPETKKAALRKIDHMAFNIAYPEKWHDYSSYRTKKDDLVFNMREVVKFQHRRDVEKLKKVSIDKEAWEGMPPQMINAYYNPQSNKFILLAGILTIPFFDMNNTDAANYGGIGMVIGHEIGHAFDQTGAQFDEKGNLKNWWTKEDLKKFTTLNNALITQANSYEVVPGVFANGKLQVGEIQADLSGIEISLRAYLRTLKDDKETKKEGMRDFFIQFAKTWKSKSRPKMLEMLNDGDGHPAAEYRINGTLKNVDAFYEAFDVKKGDGMYIPQEKRVHIWSAK